MDEADQLCERIAIMDHGKILALDTPDELKKIIPGGTSLELRVIQRQPVAAGANALNGSQNTCSMPCACCPA